jgi:hypothetical protein
MKISVHSILTAGVAVVMAGAITTASSIQPSPPQPSPPSVAAIQLTAAVQATAPTLNTLTPNTQLALPKIDLTYLLDYAARVVLPPSLGAALPAPPSSTTTPTPTDINSFIKNTYNAIEPWVRYGFELATYAVGWIPYVGWLSPQIMIFYSFGERIARSDVFNLDDWLFGPLPFVQGYINNAVDKWNAVVQLGIDQWNFWLPPLPPLPPLPLAASQTTTLTANLPTAQPQTGPTSAPSRQAPLVAKPAGQQTTVPTSVVTSTSVAAKSSSSPTATVTESPKPQITKPATGLDNALTHNVLKLPNNQVATGAANSGKPLPAAHTGLKKK